MKKGKTASLDKGTGRRHNESPSKVLQHNLASQTMAGAWWQIGRDSYPYKIVIRKNARTSAKIAMMSHVSEVMLRFINDRLRKRSQFNQFLWNKLMSLVELLENKFSTKSDNGKCSEFNVPMMIAFTEYARFQLHEIEYD